MSFEIPYCIQVNNDLKQQRKCERSEYELVITEEPSSNPIQFKHNGTGIIYGNSSTASRKTFPSIKIVGEPTTAIVLVSCVTNDAPHLPHPYSLVGNVGCVNGVCKVIIPPETMSVTFENLAIKRVSESKIEKALKLRQKIKVDPFETGFYHSYDFSLNSNSLRLCFEVYLESKIKPGTYIILKPRVSAPIFEKECAPNDFAIIKLSECVCRVGGSSKYILLFCNRVHHENIELRFFEMKESQVVWERFAFIELTKDNKSGLIWFRVPSYKDLNITEPVTVYIQMIRSSDGVSSNSVPFQYLPLEKPNPIRRKTSLDKSTYESLLIDQPKPNIDDFKVSLPIFSTIVKEPNIPFTPSRKEFYSYLHQHQQDKECDILS